MTAAAELANTREAELPGYAANLFAPKSRYRVLYGGRGGGRSWSVARALLILAAQRPLRVLCARETQSSLRDSVHQILRDQIDLMRLPGFYVTDREIRHDNGSLFLFEGVRQNVRKIKSMEGIDVCWVEEAEFISHDSWKVLIPTIRKSGSEIWVTFNPDQEDDSTYQRFVVHPPPNAWVKKVSWEDNPWLTQELRDEKDYAYATDVDGADHVWGGNLRKISAAQIMRGKWVVQDFTVPLDENGNPVWGGPYQGNDFGFASDPFAAVRCWVFDNVLYIEYEVWALHLELDDTPQHLIDTIPEYDRYVSRADSARPDSISHLRRHGITRIVGAKKGAGSVEDGIAHLRAYRQIVIHPRCRHTVDEFKLYSYKVDANTGEPLPIIVDKHNHCLVGDTLVDTDRGQVPIHALVGSSGLAFTLDGPRRFHSVRMTSPREAIYRVSTADGRSISCTADHPILTEHGWLPAVALSRGMRIVAVDTTRYALENECPRNTSPTPVAATAATKRAATTRPITAAGRQPTCIAMSGSESAARSQMDLTSTTRTATKTRSTSSASNVFRKTSTIGVTPQNSQTSDASRCGATSSSEQSPRRVRGMEPPKDARGTLPTRAIAWRVASTPELASTAEARTLSSGQSARERFARMLANPLGDGRPASMTFDGNVLVVGAPSSPTDTVASNAAPSTARRSFATVDSVRLWGFAPVYNLEVDGAHHFSVAGGLIVHNCIDSLRYALEPMIRPRRAAGFIFAESSPRCPQCDDPLAEGGLCLRCDDGAETVGATNGNGNGHHSLRGLNG